MSPTVDPRGGRPAVATAVGSGPDVSNRAVNLHGPAPTLATEILSDGAAPRSEFLKEVLTRGAMETSAPRCGDLIQDLALVSRQRRKR